MSTENNDTPENISRRKFLNRASILLGGVGGVAFGVPVVAFILGPLFQTSSQAWISLGPASKYKVGETVEVSFEDPSPLPWAGVVARTATWLKRSSDTKFVAYAVNCTHLGCPVSWLSSAQLFLCPCHGGAYYSDGTVAGGPPPKALVEFPVRINSSSNEVEIQAIGIPITRS